MKYEYPSLKDFIYECCVTLFGKRKPYHVIEPHIQPLVDVLNNIEGVATIASCQGHIGRSYPYVYFSVQSVETARLIKRWLDEDIESASLFHWDLKGHFNPQLELGFALYSHRYSPLFWELGFHRKRANREIERLAKYIEDAREIFSE